MLWGDGSPTREFLYVDDCARARARRRALRRRRAGQPRHGLEISIRELAELSPRRPASTASPLGRVEAERPAAPQARCSRARASSSASAPRALARRARADDRLVPRVGGRSCSRLIGLDRARRVPRPPSWRRSSCSSWSCWPGSRRPGWSYSAGDAAARRAARHGGARADLAVGRVIGGPLSRGGRRSSGSSRRS